MRSLLVFGHDEVIVHEGLKCWSFPLELHHNSAAGLKLFVVEEIVGMSSHRQCYYCRSVGWGNHMICNKRFHFVLPSKDSATEQTEGLTIEVNGSTMRPKLRMEAEKHLLHGILHFNGFGHLIRINGFEGGSEFTSGHQIMNLWDRICKELQVRQVSLTDVARKRTMELRLIHGLAYGEPWFQRWGYKFGHGSYGITEQMYQRSLHALRSFPLPLLIPPICCTIADVDILTIVTKYQSISPKVLKTLGDLFNYMLELKAKLPYETKVLDFRSIMEAASCRWSMRRVEMAAQVIVEELKRSGYRWVTRQEVRDAARIYIGDTGLLDFVLKSLGNHIVGNYIVRRAVNPVTKVLEYCLQDISPAFPRTLNVSSSNSGQNIPRFQITEFQINKDLLHLYKYLLMSDQPHSTTTTLFSSAIPLAVNILLDTKHLIKDYSVNFSHHANTDPEHISVTCVARLRNTLYRDLQPNEVMRIPINRTVGDLKREVEGYYRNTYWGLRNFAADLVVIENENGRELCDKDLVVGLVKIDGGVVVVEGSKNGGDGEIMFECGKRGNVDCLCGAKEEDGERMVSCDICEVWQHSRCVRIPDEEEVPSVFFCGRCESEIVKLPLTQY
ncbi:PHD finger protein PERSISTENT TAPETAL CELL 1 [Phalaenopsis equestris]|uniref:PHD finger protein PERSISTENT TAPETAL CELL 1 n=1 Tax=Phalaenopsis equestris TaxID=78828 RepID=UPI0009E5C022|nr:PHD finger protein PERSISTENT TAPETAL CELL 1 [Phalaenopsis equestris]